MLTRALVALGAVTVVVAGCVGPSRTDHDYTSKARHTVDVLRSSLETVQLTIDVIRADGDYGPYLSRLLGNVETDATAAVGSFKVVQPPSSTADDVRDDLSDAVDPGLETLSDARVAIRRNDPHGVVDLEDHVRQALERLDHFEDEHP